MKREEKFKLKYERMKEMLKELSTEKLKEFHNKFINDLDFYEGTVHYDYTLDLIDFIMNEIMDRDIHV